MTVIIDSRTIMALKGHDRRRKYEELIIHVSATYDKVRIFI